MDTPPIWLLSDGRAGNRRQVQALARALSIPARSFDIQLHAPWRWLAPHLRWPWPQAMPRALRAALDHPPALVIGCGRAAALATAMLRARVPRCIALQILDPRIALAHFDAVIAPSHDRLARHVRRGELLIETLGALNPVDTPWLEQAALAHPQLALWPAPRLAVMVGGPHRDFALDDAALAELLARAARWQHRSD